MFGLFGWFGWLGQFGNYWDLANDHCQWQLRIEHPRKEAKYFLRVDYCESTTADGTQALQCNLG